MVLSCSRMSWNFTPPRLPKGSHAPPDRDHALAHLEVRSPLRPIAIRICDSACWPWRSALGLEDVVGHRVDVDADALQDVGAAIDHGVEQFHQHHSPVTPAGHARASLFSTSANGFGVSLAHRDQPVAGEDEGHRRGAGHVGVGLAHQGRRHVAAAVLDIEAAGDFISCMSSRVGTAIPQSRSTALSSAAVGLTRSIQTAPSGGPQGRRP